MLIHYLNIPEMNMFCCRFKNLYCLLAVLFALCLVSACGQKGDLYLPDEQQALSKSYSTPA
jgi:predicted small lipoprotein YifL